MHIFVNYFSIGKNNSKRTMKPGVIILDNSNNSVEDDDYKLLSFLIYPPTEESSSMTKNTRYIDTSNDENESLLGMYLEILQEHVKSEKGCKKAMIERLKEKDKKLNELRVVLKERKSFSKQKKMISLGRVR